MREGGRGGLVTRPQAGACFQDFGSSVSVPVWWSHGCVHSGTLHPTDLCMSFEPIFYFNDSLPVLPLFTT